MGKKKKPVNKLPPTASPVPIPDCPYSITLYINYALRLEFDKASREIGRPGLANGAAAIIKSWIEFKQEEAELERIERKKAGLDSGLDEDEDDEEAI